ncbi:MAG: S8 family serine peptidase [bacterium]
MPRGARYAAKNDIQPNFSNVLAMINSFEQKFGVIEIIKQDPNAQWGDVTRTHKRTGELVRVHDFSQLFTFRFAQPVQLDSTLQAFRQLSEVEYAHQPISIVLLSDPPNDPRFSEQWNLEAVKALEAWNITHGNGEIKIGVVDNGVEQNHEDLAISGGDQLNSVTGHGTSVAGVAAAVTNNDTGIASLGWEVSLYTYQGLQGGTFEPEDVPVLLQKINDAAATVDIMNMSFLTTARATLEDIFLECPEPIEWIGKVMPYNYPEIESAIADAIAQGVICIAASGNRSLNEKFYKESDYEHLCDPMWIPFEIFPAEYPGVIAVTGTKLDQNQVEIFNDDWNYGPFVDVSAPGVNVLTTGGTNSYLAINGTSFSAPLVSALACLILYVNSSLTVQQVTDIFTSTADKIGQYSYDGNGWNQYMGYGRINAHAAALKALDDLPDRTSNSPLATAHNGGRRLARDGNGNYHLVYQAGNQVFYAKYSSGGSWSSDVRISDGLGEYGYPSIAERNGNGLVTWQRNTGSSHDLYFHKSTDGGASWPSGNRQVLATNVGTSDPLPVIASPSNNNLAIVYRSGGNLKSKHSANYGSSWPTTRTITGTALNSPSVAPALTPWWANTTALAYATAEIPNSSEIIAHYYNNGWSQIHNLTSGLPGNLSQHAHPSIAFSGDLSLNRTHVAWDAYDSFYSARVILHKVMSTWSATSVYHEFHYQTEDRPTITGLAAAKAAIAYRRGSAYVFTRTFDGSYWSSFASAAGMYPSFSIGSTQAKYVATTGSAAPYEIDLSSTTFSKSGVFVENTATREDGNIKYMRAVSLKDKDSGAWINVHLENFLIKHRDGSYSKASFSVAPPDTAVLSADQAWTALSSADFTLPVDSDSLIVVLSVAGEKVVNLANGQGALELLFQIQSPLNKQLEKNFQALRFASNEAFSRPRMRVGLSSHSFASGAALNFKTLLSNQKSDSTFVASVGHIYDYSENSTDPQFKQVSSTNSNLPREFGLAQNYPNPFNPETTLKYHLDKASAVSLKIYNLLGQEIRTLVDGVQRSGPHEIRWDGKDARGQAVASGIYVSKLQVGEQISVIKMALMK